MGSTAADVLMDTLQDWGDTIVFGLPGDGINGIIEKLRTRQDSIRFVHQRQTGSPIRESLARGEPNRSKIAWTVLSDKVREMI